MRINRIARVAAVVAVIVGAGCALPGMTAAAGTSSAESAIRAAASRNRYALVTFYKKNDAASTKMLAAAKKLQGKYSSRTDFVSVDAGNSTNRAIISRYGVDRSPIPITMVIAPNGAVTAGYPKEIKTTDISDAFVSKGMADVLKALQSGKLVALCLQNSKTKHNKESLAAAQGLNKEAKFRGVVQVIKVDPSDRAEARLLKTCKANAGSDEAQLVVFAPPGSVVGKFDGAVKTSTIAAALVKSMGGGCSGGSCGPGGCGN